MAIKTAVLRTEVERAKVGGGAGHVSHRTATPRVLPALGDYATGIAAFAKGMYDVGQGVREIGKTMRSINAKASKMQADNAQIDKSNATLDAAAEMYPEQADAFQAAKRSHRTFGQYW